MLSIIIVNYRSADLVVNAIRSLVLLNQGLNYEIIVVDNDSGDNDKKIIKEAFPAVTWLQMDYNAGFARANNAGIRQAQGDAFLLLNPDTISVDDSISRCYYQLMASSFIAAGVQLKDSNGQPQISGSFFMKGGINHLLPLPYWGDFLRWLGYKFNTRVPNVQNAGSVEEVHWISGAFLMVKREIVNIAGLMDEDFFLYAEEVEWCSRLKKHGSLVIYGELSIIHLEGGSIDKVNEIKEKGYYNLYDRKGLQLMVSNHLRVRKQYGVLWFLFLLLNYTWGVFFYFVAGILHRAFTFRNPFKDLNRVGAFGKNVFKLWLMAPRMISGKKHFYKIL